MGNEQNFRSVVARISGGLGNQLFGYAAARRFALINNADLILDTVSGFKYDRKYKRRFELDNFSCQYREATSQERFEPFPKVRRYFKRHISKLDSVDINFYIDSDNTFDTEFLSAKFDGVAYMEGYWQDERYFKDCEELIRKDLTILPPTDDTNQRLVEKINERLSVAIHARFFHDPLRNEDVGLAYYAAAIDEIETRFQNPHYFLFSDNPIEAKKKIRISNDRVTVVDNNMKSDQGFADLWLMSNCDHFIIANSTFSWWGAWLSESPSKFVVAPDFNKHGGGSPARAFSRIIPSEWTLV